MSIYHKNRHFREHGISYGLPYNTLINVNFPIRLLKAFNEDEHRDIIDTLIEKLNIRGQTFGEDSIHISFRAPFNRAQVLAIGYRKYITKCLRLIVKYNYSNVDFMKEYINHYVNENLNKYGG